MRAQNVKQLLEPLTCDDRLLYDVYMSSFYFPTLTVADELDLFSFLAQKPATPQEIVQSLSLGLRGTEALLGVLTSLGFLVQHQGRFSITEVSRNFLLPESPYYWGGALHRFRESLPTHAGVREGVQKDSLHNLTGQWQAGEFDPEQAKTFIQAMHGIAFPAAIGAARRGRFVGINRLLDVAGGSGCYCIALAMRYPEMSFTVLDLPPVCSITKQYIAKYGLQDQIDTFAANMFTDPWPSGYDAVLFSNIFHDWNREQCLQLGQRSYELLPAGGRIYLHEMLLEDTKDGPLTATAFSMQMLQATQGKQFTAGELEEILRQCGFQEVSVMPTYAYYSLLSARKA